MQDNFEDEYKSGAELLAAFNLTTREAKLEKAVHVLMQTIEQMHCAFESQSLEANLHNTEIFCSCADAYRMGHEALKP